MHTEVQIANCLPAVIPLRLTWIGSKGTSEGCEAKTQVVNRHGGCVHTRGPLPCGHVVQVRNLSTQREAPFRVAGSLAASDGAGFVYALVGPMRAGKESHYVRGVDCLDQETNFWEVPLMSITGVPVTPMSPGTGRMLEHFRSVL